jgi:hypothetical protein
MRPFFLTALALLSAPLLSAQDNRPAPASIADSLVEIGTQSSTVFQNYLLVLCRADGTYQQIISEGVTNTTIGLQTNVPASGTYTYSMIAGPTGPEGVITFSGASIYGTVTYGGGGGGINSPAVNIYPRNALTGAVNVSNNSWVTSSHATTTGFVIQGSNPRWVLVRGDGPSLSQFGVPSPVAVPQLGLYGAFGNYANYGVLAGTVNITRVRDAATGATVSLTMNPWSSDPNLAAGLQALFSLSGAFQFPSGSSDCAGLVLLPPGAYTIQGSTAGADGALLTEVYVLPYGN